MLYEQWRQCAAAHSHAPALREWATGRSWSFAELLAESERSVPPAEPWVFPRDHDAGFIFEVLRGWRHGRIVCPLEPGQPRPEIRPLPSHVVHLKTTSASTGAPRFVAFTAAQLAADPENIVATMGLRPEWPNLGVISLAHSYGFSNLVLPLLLHGIPLVLGSSSLPEAVRRAAAAIDGHFTLPGVPALWRAWHEAGAVPINVRLAISAGAPLPLELEHGIYRDHRLKVHNFYGSTECGGIAYDRDLAPRQDVGCVGAPMANVTLSLAENSCLVVQGPNVGETYWPESSPQLGSSRFETSDLASLVGDRVFLQGRANDLINVAGRKVAPELMEAALTAHPGVRQCLVLGVPAEDDPRAEMILACVAAEPGVSEGELRHFMLSRLPAWQVPRAWWFVPHLAPNDRGKVSRADWRRRYEARSQ